MRSKGRKPKASDEAQEQTPTERRGAMNWARRLKRVFNIDIETCIEYGGAVKGIACIEAPVVINRIHANLKEKPLRKLWASYLCTRRACSLTCFILFRLLL